MIIVWSEKAAATFQKNISYLKNNWTQKEVDNFTFRVFEYLELLSVEPLMARRTFKTKHTYIAVIIPHISIIYRVWPGKNTLEIVTFIDNRQSLKKNRRFL